MALDIAMGGSTNTVLHILAAAIEGGVDFTMADIDRMSAQGAVSVQGRARQVSGPSTWRTCTAPGASWPSWASWMRAVTCSTTEIPTVHARTIGAAIDQWDISRTNSPEVRDLLPCRAGRGGDDRSLQPGSQRWPELDLDREAGVIRSAATPFSKDGGLAVLKGNIALDGCIVKTAGVDDSILVFSGPARVF